MKVHAILGNGFQELIYQRALAIEMKVQGLTFNRELEMPTFYESKNIGSRRPLAAGRKRTSLIVCGQLQLSKAYYLAVFILA